MCNKCIWLIASVLVLVLFTGLAQGQTVYVNFQQPASETPEGYLGDGGEVFGDRGNGCSYGWDRDITGDARDRGSAGAEDQRYDTLNHLQKASPPAVWEIVLDNGLYNIFLVCGDPDNTDQTNNMLVEGVLLEDPDGQDNWDEYEVTVDVADGRLTITADADAGAANAKITFVHIILAMAPESARSPSPEKEATDVPRDLTVSWEPGEGVSAHDVYLGTSFEDVNSASRVNPMDVLISQGQSGTTSDVGRLEFSQTYYWRIDEVLTAGGIYKGDVWSFTVEPYTYAVENVIATTNATSDPGLGIENTIDGSGLNDDAQHSTVSSDMWLGLPGGEDTIWIQYEFNQAYKLDEMLVWNYNVQFEPVLGFGLKDVTVEYSADGAEWTSLGDTEFVQATAREDYVANTAVDFAGEAVKYVKITVNANHGSLAQYGLSEVRFMYIPATAREPIPASEAVGVNVDSVLSWRAGREAASHEVYLGTDEDDLALADTVSDASFMPETLDFGTTYYWKVSEVNETEAISVWEGGVWSFTAQEYAAIDDFESYTDDEGSRIYETWMDGWVNETGSTVGYLQAPFAEQSIVHSGSQSMPLEYDNGATPFYSETERDLASLDLTASGANTLRLFVAGQAPAFIETADGTIAMNAIGADIWGVADEFRFAYKNLTGDGSIIARVDALDASPSTWVKTGVMIRQDTEAGAINAFMAMTGGDGGGATFQQRVTADTDSVSEHTYEGNPFAPPYWVRLDRVGSAFSAFISPDGETWQQAADTVTVAMGDPVLIGLAVTSHNAAVATSAAFSNISTTGNVTGQWQMAEIGVAQPTGGNTADDLYVALEDSAGHVGIATNPTATVLSSWQEWLIPLSEFGGVNLNSVTKIYIGLGDRNNPTAGGSGRVFIDDLQFGYAAVDAE